MTPIPKAARPIADYIAKTVPRPEELPICEDGIWIFRGRRLDPFACAIANHPRGHTLAAFFKQTGLTREQDKEFTRWWNETCDVNPQAAVNAIWGKQK